MKKAAAAVLALLVAFPAMALPVCAAACGASQERFACCCGPKALPADGMASYTAPPCCPTPSAAAVSATIDSAFSTGQRVFAAELGAPLATPLFAALPTAAPPAEPARRSALPRAGPSGPPIFLRTSSLLR